MYLSEYNLDGYGVGHFNNHYPFQHSSDRDGYEVEPLNHQPIAFNSNKYGYGEDPPKLPLLHCTQFRLIWSRPPTAAITPLKKFSWI